ncbi:MAG: T9SS type A sorting domain-containing protein [Bacteroidia bacterium]|nr:T9SS type A sorting domain-containing protein [Bacteroidia bacterium]
MKKLYFTSLFILFFSIGFSQSYPYLNASTANENEFPVDKDTNIYMFHGNRLVKTDKNFNTIWAKTYGSIYFKSILLSKTGSIYFIARASSPNTIIGRISPSGSVIWSKTTQNITAVVSGTTNVNYTMDCQRLFLDRNNHLIITGGEGFSQSKGFLMKTDTSGNVLKFKAFSNGFYWMDKLSIIDDSSGYYKLIGSGYQSMGPSVDVGLYNYSDNTDAFTRVQVIMNLGIPSYFGWRLIKSKFPGNFYIQTSTQNSSSVIYAGMNKYNTTGQLKWTKGFSNFHGIPHAFAGYLEESEKGDLFYSLSTNNFLNNHTSGFIKIDSSGIITNNYATSILYNYPSYNAITMSFYFPEYKPRVVNDNNYYFDVAGFNFPLNPLTIQKYNSSLILPCASTIACSISGINSPIFSGPFFNPVLVPITSYSISSYTPSVTSVTFSVNPNFCIVLGADEVNTQRNELILYPNPANDKLYINAENLLINEVEIFDVNGKKTEAIYNSSTLGVTNLVSGIYFIRIKTDKGEFNKKFIKN